MPISSTQGSTGTLTGGEKPRGSEAELSRLKDACREFEAVFLRELLKVMRTTVPGGKSSQQRMYTELFDEEISNALAERGTGLAEMMASCLAEQDFSSQTGEKAKVSGETDDKFPQEGP
jgi:Rod binding domain-containing protein